MFLPRSLTRTSNTLLLQGSKPQLSAPLHGRPQLVTLQNEVFRVEKRFYTLRKSSYYSHYIPPTGVPTEKDNDEPWDASNRPKRRVGQIAVRLEKMIRENDYYTMFKEPETITHVHAPIEIPEARNGMTVEKFLKTIGRGCDEHIDKFESWDDLFTFKSRKLKELGIGVRDRKWILNWVERYRQGYDPWYVPLRSKAKRNSYDKLEWRQKLLTQKDLREKYGLDD